MSQKTKLKPFGFWDSTNPILFSYQLNIYLHMLFMSHLPKPLVYNYFKKSSASFALEGHICLTDSYHTKHYSAQIQHATRKKKCTLALTNVQSDKQQTKSQKAHLCM